MAHRATLLALTTTVVAVLGCIGEYEPEPLSPVWELSEGEGLPTAKLQGDDCVASASCNVLGVRCEVLRKTIRNEGGGAAFLQIGGKGFNALLIDDTAFFEDPRAAKPALISAGEVVFNLDGTEVSMPGRFDMSEAAGAFDWLKDQCGDLYELDQ